MPGFLTDAQLNDALADQLQKTRGTLAPFWSGIVTGSNQWAYNELASRLVARGFTLAQVTAWDRGVEFQQDLGVFKCLEKAEQTSPDDYDAKAMSYLDRRDELSGNPAKNIEACIVTAGFVFQAPQTMVGNPNTGPVRGMRVSSPLEWGRCGWDGQGWCPWE